MSTVNNALDFELNWHKAPSNSDCVSNPALADLCIRLGDQVATKVENLLDGGTRPTIRVDAYRAAVWFAYNWWRLCWEPERQKSADWQMAHNLATAGGGFVWPHLSFASDGQTITASVFATEENDNVSVRYLNTFTHPLQLTHFESSVADFIERVISHLDSDSEAHARLGGLWHEVCIERNHVKKTAWRKLEALLGFDPDQAPAELLTALQSQQAQWGEKAIGEVAAAEQTNTQIQLDKLTHLKTRTTTHVNNASELRRFVRDLSDDMQPWKRAEKAAAQARQQWGVPQEPLQDKRLAELFELPVELFEQTQSQQDIISAGFRHADNQQLAVFLNKGRNTGRRFALARLVGDYLVAESSDRLLPATTASTARQKFQRAFAQELLCPFDLLQEYINTDSPGDDDIDAAAEHFAVSPLLVQNTLVNRGVLGHDELAA